MDAVGRERTTVVVAARIVSNIARPFAFGIAFREVGLLRLERPCFSHVDDAVAALQGLCALQNGILRVIEDMVLRIGDIVLDRDKLVDG